MWLDYCCCCCAVQCTLIRVHIFVSFHFVSLSLFFNGTPLTQCRIYMWPNALYFLLCISISRSRRIVMSRLFIYLYFCSFFRSGNMIFDNYIIIVDTDINAVCNVRFISSKMLTIYTVFVLFRRGDEELGISIRWNILFFGLCTVFFPFCRIHYTHIILLLHHFSSYLYLYFSFISFVLGSLALSFSQQRHMHKPLP